MKRKTKRYQEGGKTEEQYKKEGLESSKGDKVGFFERLTMGNIDDPRSEAYRRFGAGRAKMDEEAKKPVPETSKTSSDYSGRNAKSYGDDGMDVPHSSPTSKTASEDYLEKRGAKPIEKTGTRENTLYKEDEKKSKPPAKKAQPDAGKAKEKVGKGYENIGKATSKSSDAKDVKKPPVDENDKPVKLGSQGSFKFDSDKGSSGVARNRAGMVVNPSFVAPKKASEEDIAEAREALAKKRAEQSRSFRESPLMKAISGGGSRADFYRKKREKEESDKSMKRGGAVRKYAGGGTATSKPEPKKDTMPESMKNERENRRRDELNKREAEGAAKEVKRNMSTFGFKKGGSASSRADGIAIRGKTRA